MAIDAVIERVRVVADGLRLELAPRWMPDVGHDSCAGQPALVIVGPRHYDPPVGAQIWGSANHCEIIVRSGEEERLIQYRRLSYTRIEESDARDE